MAYAAVVSLQQTIERLLNSSQTSILPASRQMIELASEKVRSLQELLCGLERSNGERVNDLNAEIREEACKLEDSLESPVSRQFLSQYESLGSKACSRILSLDMEEVKEAIKSFMDKVKTMEEECCKLELSNPLTEQDDVVSSRIDSRGKKSNIVGLAEERRKIKHLITDWRSMGLNVVSLVGMAGIGKSTIAEEVYEDVLVSYRFSYRAWVTIGPEYNFKMILLHLLRPMNYDIVKIQMEEDDKLVDYLRTILEGKRYFIVLDDTWNKEDWDKLKSFLPDDQNGSRVLLTTRVEEVAQHADKRGVHQLRFLNDEESWDLLCKDVFLKKKCPPELEKDGKKIAKNCEGLPLAIVMVGNLLRLSEDKMTATYWKEAAEKKNSLFIDAHENISEVLLPSYKYLAQHLKACFLYLGVFPASSEIPASKLIKLWSAEGFLEVKQSNNIEEFAVDCLEELVSRSLVLRHQWSSSFRTKTCGLHSVFRHLCIREAGKEKLFHVLNSSTANIESKRRLCIHNNIILGIKHMQTKMEELKDHSRLHSLLCTGPHHQYQVPIPFGFDLGLLRILDALTIRFYKFPNEVLKLVQLRHLALTYNGQLPNSISKLWKLQYLIVHRHLSVKYSSGADSYLPMEIWDMKELKHLQFMGSNLPDLCDALLPNLLTLSDVSAYSCTKGILERIPNLKKLGIQIDVAPDADEPLSCFDHLPHLHRLESLKCVITNPEPTYELAGPPVSIAIFPPNLKKLSLSGFGYPWESMKTIAELPNLEVLKLRCYAFQGQKWVTRFGEFEQLQYLLIEDTDLEYWIAEGYSFPILQHLVIRHCYKLKKIPFGMAATMIELADCPSAKKSVEQIQEDYGFPQTSVHVSWDDHRKLKS